jgi:hypothetical protein
MNTFLTLLVAESGDPGEPRLLTDVFLMVVFFAFILILTSPFWGLGTIYWSLHRRSKQIRKNRKQPGPCFQNKSQGRRPSDSSAVDGQFLPGESGRMRPLLPTGTEAVKQEEQPRSATALEPVIQQPRARGHGCGK